jgi:hypothetical protein
MHDVRRYAGIHAGKQTEGKEAKPNSTSMSPTESNLLCSAKGTVQRLDEIAKVLGCCASNWN